MDVVIFVLKSKVVIVPLSEFPTTLGFTTATTSTWHPNTGKICWVDEKYFILIYFTENKHFIENT